MFPMSPKVWGASKDSKIRSFDDQDEEDEKWKNWKSLYSTFLPSLPLALAEIN